MEKIILVGKEKTICLPFQ